MPYIPLGYMRFIHPANLPLSLRSKICRQSFLSLPGSFAISKQIIFSIDRSPYRAWRFALGVDLIFKVAAIGIIVAVVNQLLMNSGRQEQALMTTLAGLVVVLLIVVQEISTLFDSIKTMFGM